MEGEDSSERHAVAYIGASSTVFRTVIRWLCAMIAAQHMQVNSGACSNWMTRFRKASLACVGIQP